MIKLALVDDHNLFRQGIKLLLEDIGSVELIIEGSNGQELLDAMEDQVPDIVLLDLEMPVLNGIETSKIIKDKYEDVGIIILTMYDDEQMIAHLMEIGANGYLLKDTTQEELQKAIQSVYENQFYFNDFVSKALLSGVRAKRKPEPKIGNNIEVTRRESEVLQLICEELTTQEMADKLFLSPRTVEGHRQNLIEKFGVKNTAGLIIRAIKLGFITV
ncbi:MAG: response regulator transcription factor [Roseivirga sp.]|nr:response regulator transcription factor [Roseivirga sp.]